MLVPGRWSVSIRGAVQRKEERTEEEARAVLAATRQAARPAGECRLLCSSCCDARGSRRRGGSRSACSTQDGADRRGEAVPLQNSMGSHPAKGRPAPSVWFASLRPQMWSVCRAAVILGSVQKRAKVEPIIGERETRRIFPRFLPPARVKNRFRQWTFDATAITTMFWHDSRYDGVPFGTDNPREVHPC